MGRAGLLRPARNLHKCARRLPAIWWAFPPTPSNSPNCPWPLDGGGGGGLCLRAAGGDSFDGNVKRVLCRQFGIEGFPAGGDPSPTVDLAESPLPTGDIDFYNAGPDGPAPRCVRAAGRAAGMPGGGGCIARRDGRQGELPASKPRAAVPERTSSFVLLTMGPACCWSAAAERAVGVVCWCRRKASRTWWPAAGVDLLDQQPCLAFRQARLHAFSPDPGRCCAGVVAPSGWLNRGWNGWLSAGGGCRRSGTDPQADQADGCFAGLSPAAAYLAAAPGRPPFGFAHFSACLRAWASLWRRRSASAALRFSPSSACRALSAWVASILSWGACRALPCRPRAPGNSAACCGASSAWRCLLSASLFLLHLALDGPCLRFPGAAPRGWLSGIPCAPSLRQALTRNFWSQAGVFLPAPV